MCGLIAHKISSFFFQNYMAVVPICCKMPHKDQLQPIQHVMRQCERGLPCNTTSILDGPRRFSSKLGGMCCKWHSLDPNNDVLRKAMTRGNAGRGPLHKGDCLQFKKMTEITARQRRNDAEYHSRSMSRDDSQNGIWYASDSSTNEKQLRSLDCYFGKLREGRTLLPSDSSSKTEELPCRSNELRSKKELEILDAYLDKLNKGKIHLCCTVFLLLEVG